MQNINDRLIYDVGAHHGEDTEFYLKKGFDVVAIDAVPDNCRLIGEKLSSYVAGNRLRILNCAISDSSEPISFYVNDDVSVWSTANKSWVERNNALRPGQKIREIRVNAEKLANIVAKFGVPLYCKIDIEGNDFLALRSFANAPSMPRYISIESEKLNWPRLLNELLTMKQLGYRKFKVVNQNLIGLHNGEMLGRHGNAIQHTFAAGSSGPFGEEAPGRWMDIFECIEVYKGIFRGYFLNGDFGIVKNQNPQLPAADWYDTHASLDPL